VLSRVFPDEFRETHVQRLAGFFQNARDTLARARPHIPRQPQRRASDSGAVQ
jgi:uncharacterized circularly permuted ATP-grasp superfamily protein